MLISVWLTNYTYSIFQHHSTESWTPQSATQSLHQLTHSPGTSPSSWTRYQRGRLVSRVWVWHIKHPGQTTSSSVLTLSPSILSSLTSLSSSSWPCSAWSWTGATRTWWWGGRRSPPRTCCTESTSWDTRWCTSSGTSTTMLLHRWILSSDWLIVPNIYFWLVDKKLMLILISDWLHKRIIGLWLVDTKLTMLCLRCWRYHGESSKTIFSIRSRVWTSWYQHMRSISTEHCSAASSTPKLNQSWRLFVTSSPPSPGSLLSSPWGWLGTRRTTGGQLKLSIKHSVSTADTSTPWSPSSQLEDISLISKTCCSDWTSMDFIIENRINWNDRIE